MNHNPHVRELREVYETMRAEISGRLSRQMDPPDVLVENLIKLKRIVEKLEESEGW